MKRWLTARGLAALAAVAPMAVAAGCGGGPAETDRAGAVTAGVSGVAVRGFAYRPGVLMVEAGTTVEWTNDDKILHTVTSGLAPGSGVPGISEGVAARPDGVFHLELDGAGAIARFTFGEPGTFEYFCAIHAGMKGRVDVR